ncbi:abscission/NoCut checkpoint regulator-like [Asterias rubens]|uniref:abscission/NoCut checkpoint regulator-like n=1 Tax=Asterias rubens TaxID=7604 RepID=UPI001455217A|nr:abscission/NoCut checkpoint regulator-like [Asterias rubens]
MSGHCFSCTDKFGIFKREHGCKSCGYAFCSKCVSNSIVLPNQGTKEQHVCNKCYQRLTAPPVTSTDQGKNKHMMEPPENFKKRIAVLASKNQMGTQASATSTSFSVNSRKRGLVRSQDVEIADRLERLKEDRKKARGRTLSTEEIEDRLQRLKGNDPHSASSTASSVPPHQAPDQRTQFEQTKDLMEQMKEEAAIDAKREGMEISEESAGGGGTSSEQNFEEEMMKLMQDAQEELKKDEEGLKRDAELAVRLAKLNTKTSGGDGPKGGEGAGVDDEEEDEEAATQRLIKQLLEEDKLEARMGATGYSAQDPQSQPLPAQKPSGAEVTSDPDELPWCCICNEDASLRCHGCDEDLYCSRCFKEGHDGYDLKDHRTSNFRPKAGRK